MKDLVAERSFPKQQHDRGNDQSFLMIIFGGISFFLMFCLRFSEFVVNMVFTAAIAAIVAWYLGYIEDAVVSEVMMNVGDRVLGIIEAFGFGFE